LATLIVASLVVFYIPLTYSKLLTYRLSVVTVALSVTIRPQFAIECLRRWNQQGGASLWAQI